MKNSSNLQSHTLRFLFGWLLLLLATLNGSQTMGGSEEGTKTNAAQIDREVNAALDKLYETTPMTRTLAVKARGILVFPNVLKASKLESAPTSWCWTKVGPEKPRQQRYATTSTPSYLASAA